MPARAAARQRRWPARPRSGRRFPLACRRLRLSGHDQSEDQHDRQVEQNNQVEQNGWGEQVRHDPRGDQDDRQVEQNHQIEQVRPGPPCARASRLLPRRSRRLDGWRLPTRRALGKPSICAGEFFSSKPAAGADPAYARTLRALRSCARERCAGSQGSARSSQSHASAGHSSHQPRRR